jgi:hypothetical protein
MRPFLSTLTAVNLIMSASIGPTFANEILRSETTYCEDLNLRELVCHTKAFLFINTTSEFYECVANFDGLLNPDRKTVARATVTATCELWVQPFNSNGDYAGGVGDFLMAPPGKYANPSISPHFGWAFRRSGKEGRVCFAKAGTFSAICADVEFK